MRILAILVILCTLLSVGCNSDKSEYDAGIAAYKRGHYAVALSNFESRAMEGDPVAQFCLGYMYKHGKGVRENNQTALDWYTKAAAQGHVPALNNRALIYGQQALELRLSLDGEALARLIEGKDIKTYIDVEGKKIIDNLEASVEDLGKGIVRDDPNNLILYNLALLQIEIVKVFFQEDVEEDVEAIAKWHENAVISLGFAARMGYAPAQNQLATIYKDGLWGESPDREKALEWYEKTAKQGFAAAQYNLAEMINEDALKMYAKDSAEASKLTIKALEWYEKAAEQRYAPAQYRLAQNYDPGIIRARGGSLDSKTLSKFQHEALKWYRKAAEQRYAPAQSRLATLYYDSDGLVKRNVEMGFRLKLEAAQAGEAFAEYLLATDFIPHNYQEAYYWYNLALKNKASFDDSLFEGAAAVTNLSDLGDEIEKNLSEEQKREVQERVDKWKPRILYGSGTGFYIDKKHILTNAHVVTWKDRDGNKHKFDELRIGYRYVVDKTDTESVDHDVDLALLLDPRGNMDNFATFRNDPVDGAEGVISFGYPLSIVLSYRGNVTSGIVSGLSGVISDDRPENLFQHTAPIQSGNSGGPMFDLSGNVIGVTVSGLIREVKIKDDNKPQIIKIDPPQNANFAIKFSVIEEFLRKNGVTPSTEDLDSSINDYRNRPITDDDRKKIYEKAQAFTLPVLGFRNKDPEPSPLHEISIKMLEH